LQALPDTPTSTISLPNSAGDEIVEKLNRKINTSPGKKSRTDTEKWAKVIRAANIKL